MISQGAIYALVGVCFISATAVTIRQIAATESGVTIAFYFMALSSVALAVALPFFWTTPTSCQWLLLAGIGIAGGLVQLTSTVALRYAPVSTLVPRSEEHTSEHQSLMRISYDVFCFKKKK